MEETARDDRNDRDESASGSVEWPYSSLLLFGFFGTDTPAGRKLARRTTAGLVLLIIAGLALGSEREPIPRWVWVTSVPVAVAGIALAHARYLGQLDELSRLIQLKAFAFAYAVVMVLAMGLSAVVLTRPSMVHPALLLGGLIVVEALRGLALVVLARRYR